ncbi:MAG: leucine-rich repeat domain-containing protein, partial [Bacteroidales bacterium]|nr:leucine-rich repeat domain-containing protein [Bacteroidales bacterium]
MKKLFFTIIVLLSVHFIAFSQLKDSKIYTSLDEALKKPLEVSVLDLSGQNLTQLDDKISELKNLQVLYLQDNKLTALPESLCKNTKLQFLYADENSISKLPKISRKKIISDADYLVKERKKHEDCMPSHLPVNISIQKS